MTPEERQFRERTARRMHLRRVWLELSQDEVAGKAGVSRNFVSAIERGAQGLDAYRLALLAGALDVDLAWLLGDGPDELAVAPSTYRKVGR